MASKQDNYLRMHHPSIYKGMKNGGKVKKKNYYAEGGKNTDTVPAMLTPGEVVLNAEQQEALGKLVGMKPAALFEKIGIPGFAGGGMVNKKDVLMKAYKKGGIVKRVKADAMGAGHSSAQALNIGLKTANALKGQTGYGGVERDITDVVEAIHYGKKPKNKK